MMNLLKVFYFNLGYENLKAKKKKIAKNLKHLNSVEK